MDGTNLLDGSESKENVSMIAVANNLSNLNIRMQIQDSSVTTTKIASSMGNRVTVPEMEFGKKSSDVGAAMSISNRGKHLTTFAAKMQSDSFYQDEITKNQIYDNKFSEVEEKLSNLENSDVPTEKVTQTLDKISNIRQGLSDVRQLLKTAMNDRSMGALEKEEISRSLAMAKMKEMTSDDTFVQVISEKN